MPLKREIIYPFFLECTLSEDKFWNNIFEDLAYGIPPSGTYINKGYLCCSYKNKEFSYKIERKTPQILYDEIYSLLINKVGILSQREKQKQKIEFEEIEKTLKNSKKKWTDIRKKNIRNFLLERYVLKLKDQCNLDITDCRMILTIISIATMFKLIGNKDINYENDAITSINGIEINGDNDVIIKYDIDNINYSEESVEDENVEKRDFLSNWNTYVKQKKKKHKI